MDEEVVTELIQGECNSKKINAELTKILNSEYRQKLLKKYEILEEKLGGEGASEKVAQLIVASIARF
jgi:lipid-A-disaccharide synthase